MAQRNTKLSQEEFLERVCLLNPTIKIISQYTRRKDNVQCECLICGHIWNPTADKLLEGRGCPICAKKKRTQCCPQSHESFMEKFQKTGNKNVILLEKYTNSSTKIHCKCNKCGYEWSAVPPSLLKGHVCSKCGNELMKHKQRKSHEQFMKEFSEVGNPDIEIIGRYINSSHKIKVRCKKCGREWEMSPIKILYEGQGCIDCYRKNNIRENNPRWNPNKTNEERIIKRDYMEYSLFVKEVLKRDQYTCQITGQIGHGLVVHHLNGYSWDIDNRLNTDNGITLSKDIHIEFHKKYGYKNNTKEQFIDFIKILYEEKRITEGKYDSLMRKLDD